MTEWKRVFESRRAVSPPGQTPHLGQQPSQAFHILFKHFVCGGHFEQKFPQGLQGPHYQLRVSLFDISHRHFFGRTWKSSLQQMRTSPGQSKTVPFNEALYFHTSLRLPSIVAVVEVVAVTDQADGSQRALGCGFAILRLFSAKADPAEGLDSKEPRRLCLYHGSPRALLHPSLHEPVEKNQLMLPMDGACLHCCLQPHPPLDLVTPLLPQNMLVSGSEPIPGLISSSDGSADVLQKPRLLKSLTCYLDKLSISLYPSLEKFEEDLLLLLNMDRLNQRGCGPDGKDVTIQERRLHVGVHNGWGFLSRPQVVVLEPEPLVSKGLQQTGSLPRGSLSRSSTCCQVLGLRSRLQLKEMVNHPAFGVVFQLEYVFSAPLGGDSKLSFTSSSKMAFMQCVRWATWCPFQVLSRADAPSEVCLALRGGPGPNPGGVMVYTAPHLDWNSREGEDPEGGAVKFRFTVRSEGQAASTPISARKRLEEASWHKRSPSPLRGGVGYQALPSPPPISPQGPGLSISQLAATPRYPTISHTVASPWRQQLPAQLHASPMASTCQLPHAELPCASSIAHLEVSFSPPSVDPAVTDEEPLREVTFTPVHAPVITLGTQTPGSSSSMPRSSIAHLYSAGFPDILDYRGQVADVLDPGDPINFNPQKEEADPLQCNKLVLQFLAFSRVRQDSMDADWPKSVYFSFQVYRFPPVKTQRLLLLSTEKAQLDTADRLPCVLAVARNDSSIASAGPPGLELTFLADPAFLKPGERPWFLQYLALHTLQIDVWDADSLLLVGSAAVELKHLLRQGRPAVQVMQELEVITTEYLQEALMVSGRRAVAPINVFTVVRGKLLLRMASVGLPFDQSVKRPRTLPPSHSRVIQAQGGTHGFAGGSLCSDSVLGRNARNASHARRLVDIDADLAALLYSRMKAAPPRAETEGGAEVAQRRKLTRMEAVRQYEEQGHIPPRPRLANRREEHVERFRDLGVIEAYRERHKAESIAAMLSRTITARHTVYAALGTAEFFEFVLRNPFNMPRTVTVECEDPGLSVITSSREWRHFKELTRSTTPLEEDMFHLKGGTRTPQVYLRPKETLHIPLKYQTFALDYISQEPTDVFTSTDVNLIEKHQLNSAEAKIIKVVFRAEDGKPLAICEVSVERIPHVIDQTFRFYHPELTVLKKAIRLPPWDSMPGVLGGNEHRMRHIHVRCSDPNVICDTKNMSAVEPQDVYLKVSGAQSPQIKRFFIAVFLDEWLAAPAQVWQVYVHFLQRVDISCVSGQLTWQSLVLRGTRALRKVRCYTSHPGEIQVDPVEVFALPAAAVQDLRVGVRAWRPGGRFAYLNVVDVEHRQLVSSWLLCLSCRQPLISKAFEIFLPVGGGKGSSKKITYTNPYQNKRVFLLRTTHPDLLHFKEDSVEIGGGETYTIGLRFASGQSAGVEEILVFINNHDDTNEETFCIRVQYR
ncbi:nephrocystin-4 isoform X2 [Brienomyrus brachyistius]|uniref:nephrocystin-4 isoform X2 n=1 Tax=Brienomyrus brachyistius TaxID=42636 RepID=UPI0020B334A2|nr:nephrocystin-4 isoform X2 [Brienomyrus brachyistius]